MNNRKGIIEQMNRWGKEGIPFLFIIDFEMNKPLIFKLAEIDPQKLLYNVNGITNFHEHVNIPKKLQLIKYPGKFEDYLVKFNIAKQEIISGNSYLLNLTCSTPVDLNISMLEVYMMSNSRYRIWFEDQFICFSPETFITIKNGLIRSFPMKGTIDAAIPEAEKIILNDHKETAEHYTIVDLIRNDLNMVTKGAIVDRFRYIDTIVTNEKKLLQVSSDIRGELNDGYLSHIGDIIYALLPAGSVTGAPKRKTTEIIAKIEGRKRGYYTGVFGIFDGSNVDCCVMIRFIEKNAGGYIYQSGGGITSFSDPMSEYNEMIDKIYVPVI